MKKGKMWNSVTECRGIRDRNDMIGIGRVRLKEFKNGWTYRFAEVVQG